jgi:spermidine synthase
MAWAVVAASGFASLALEVVWFRLMTQYLDATTYAFTTTLAIVLVGIALGGAVAARLLKTDRDWHAWLAVLQFATGVAVLLGVGLITWDHVPLASGMRPMQRVLLGFLVPSLLMGVSFPLLLRVGVPPAGDDAEAHGRGRLVGRFYGLNVLGAILGSLAGGFLLLPLAGTRLSLIVLAAVFTMAGAALCAVHPGRHRMALVAAAGFAAFLVLAPAIPDPFVAAALSRIGPGTSEIFREEGVQAAVSVHASGFQRTLQVGGLHQANDSPAMVRLHRQIGALPVALHPTPARALVIGLGGGVTAGAVSQHVGTTVQIVELSDSVRKAAALFAHVNYDVLNQPNVRIRVDDGRNFLLLSGERFDIVTADIIQPNHAGAGALYSREYFTLVKQALAPGGLVLQWIGQRQRSHYELIMRTFHDVFPHTTLWLDGQLMVGGVEPLQLDAARFAAKLEDAATRAMLAEAGIDSFETLRAWYTAGPREVAAFVGDGPILTDDRPLVEYFRSVADAGPPIERFPLRGDVAELGRP